MKIVQTVILVILILMSLSAGAVKVLQMPQEVQFFEEAGLSVVLLMLLGAAQIAGGVLSVFQKFRLPGAALMAGCFFASTIVIFMVGKVAFGIFSLLPVLLAGFIIMRERGVSIPSKE